jgi:hypothetical protein
MHHYVNNSSSIIYYEERSKSKVVECFTFVSGEAILQKKEFADCYDFQILMVQIFAQVLYLS